MMKFAAIILSFLVSAEMFSQVSSKDLKAHLKLKKESADSHTAVISLDTLFDDGKTLCLWKKTNTGPMSKASWSLQSTEGMELIALDLVELVGEKTLQFYDFYFPNTTVSAQLMVTDDTPEIEQVIADSEIISDNKINPEKQFSFVMQHPLFAQMERNKTSTGLEGQSTDSAEYISWVMGNGQLMANGRFGGTYEIINFEHRSRVTFYDTGHITIASADITFDGRGFAFPETVLVTNSDSKQHSFKCPPDKVYQFILDYLINNNYVIAP